MFITSNGTPEDSKECSGRKRYNTVILYGKQKQYCCQVSPYGVSF